MRIAVDQESLKFFNDISVGSAKPGDKYDTNKPDMGLVLSSFSRALIEVSKVGTFGAKKYTKDGWIAVPNGVARYTSAELRHHFYEETEGPFDRESGLLHKAHKAWNALAALDLYLRDQECKSASQAHKDDWGLHGK